MSIDSSELWFVCEGHAAARTVRLSPGWEQPLGRRAEQQLEQATLELIHPDDARGWLEWVTRLLAGSCAGTLQTRVRHGNGQHPVFEWRGLGLPERALAFGVGRPFDGAGSADRNLIAFGDGLEVDVKARQVRVADEPLALTRSEFDLLVLLLDSRGSVLTVDRIAREVWQYNEAGHRNFLQAHISRLRGKLRQAGQPDPAARQRVLPSCGVDQSRELHPGEFIARVSKQIAEHAVHGDQVAGCIAEQDAATHRLQDRAVALFALIEGVTHPRLRAASSVRRLNRRPIRSEPRGASKRARDSSPRAKATATS